MYTEQVYILLVRTRSRSQTQSKVKAMRPVDLDRVKISDQTTYLYCDHRHILRVLSGYVVLLCTEQSSDDWNTQHTDDDDHHHHASGLISCGRTFLLVDILIQGSIGTNNKEIYIYIYIIYILYYYIYYIYILNCEKFQSAKIIFCRCCRSLRSFVARN